MKMSFESFLPSKLAIRSRKKDYSNNDDLTMRVISPNETISRIIPLCNTVGITRISDITGLDKLNIPNYTVVLPGTEDAIWVYGGKGPTKSHAKASALMEAVERYSSLSTINDKSYIQGSYFEISKSFKRVLHPNEVMEPVSHIYRDKSSIVDFLPGFDLLNLEEVLVPAQLVLSRYSAKPPSVSAFPYSHTNGLASGNVLEEAICQALCEVIERDAVSIADLCCSAIPYTLTKQMATLLAETQYAGRSITEIVDHQFVDDSGIFLDVDISETTEVGIIKYLTDRFNKSGIPLLIKNITQQDIGIPTFVASSAEWITDDYGYFAKGYGCHPDSRIALIRAITEVSQTRATNIQGARDDMIKRNYQNADKIVERKWQFIRSSHRSKEDVIFSEIKTYANKDLVDDIKVILRGLKKAGLKRAIIVELTHPKVGVPVVRAIVPGLETFEVARLFMDQDIPIGKRAKNQFRSFLHSS